LFGVCGPGAGTIRGWAYWADSIGHGGCGLAEADRDRRISELERQLEIEREEKEILKRAAAWFARESVLIPRRGSCS
jgi:transposase-like protein